MPDNRTKRQKLEAMAAQTSSPHEAAIAREKLAKMGPDPEPQPYQRMWTDPLFTSTSRMDFSGDFSDLFNSMFRTTYRNPSSAAADEIARKRREQEQRKRDEETFEKPIWWDDFVRKQEER